MALDEKLAAARAAAAKLESLKEIRAKLRKNRARFSTALDTAAKGVAAEQRDVNVLEGIGIVPLWHALWGSRPEALQEATRKLETATTRYEELKAGIAVLDARIAHFDAEIRTLANAPDEIERLIAAKQRHLAECDGPRALVELADEIDRLRSTLRKADAVLFQGNAACVALKQAVAELASARQWTAADVVSSFFNNDIVDVDESARLDGSLQQVRRVLMELDRCCDELQAATMTKLDLKPCSMIPGILSSLTTTTQAYDTRIEQALSRALKRVNRNMKKTRERRTKIALRLQEADDLRRSISLRPGED